MKEIRSVDAFPLAWPQGYQKTSRRIGSRFGSQTLYKVWPILRDEVRRLGGKDLIVSSNMPLRNDGIPYASKKEPDDPGVAVYFDRKGKPICLACDQYSRVWENAYAIAKTIEAMRAIDRWGVSDMLDRMFTGFMAITDDAGKSLFSILGISPDASKEEITAAYRRKMKEVHPDLGGDPEAAGALTIVYRELMDATV